MEASVSLVDAMARREVDGSKAAEDSLVVGIAGSDASPAGVFLRGKSAMAAGRCVSRDSCENQKSVAANSSRTSEETYLRHKGLRRV